MIQKAKKFQNFRRFIIGISGLLLFLSLFTNTKFDNKFINNPRIPITEIGLINPYHLKGIVVYVTDRQSRILTALWWTQIGSGSVILISLFLNQKWPLQKKE